MSGGTGREQIASALMAYLRVQDVGNVLDGMGVDDPLFDSGALDSFALVELVVFLERTYRIEFSADDLVPENFDTVASIAATVERKVGPEDVG